MQFLQVLEYFYSLKILSTLSIISGERLFQYSGSGLKSVFSIFKSL